MQGLFLHFQKTRNFQISSFSLAFLPATCYNEEEGSAFSGTPIKLQRRTDMALIAMDLYKDLEKSMAKAKESGEKYTVHLSRIKKDLKKRKSGLVARIVILAFWAVALLVLALLATGILELGGGASASVGSAPVETPASPAGTEVLLAFLPALFVPATWSLCFVGFPIGWGWSQDDRESAKDQLYVQYTVREDGTVDTFQSSLVPKASAFIFSLFLGVLTMVASIPVAVVQCFTWPRQIKQIEAIVAEVEANELFVAV
jgi:hypothetical protein